MYHSNFSVQFLVQGLAQSILCKDNHRSKTDRLTKGIKERMRNRERGKMAALVYLSEDFNSFPPFLAKVSGNG